MSDAGSEGGGEEYVVEKILLKRLVKGKTEYFLKWQGFGEEDNTWEPEENLGCPELIAEFERQWEEKERKKREARQAAKKRPASVVDVDEDYMVVEHRKETKRDSSIVSGEASSKRAKTTSSWKESSYTSPRVSSRPTEINGFDRGLRPSKIIGASDATGELMFLMQWKDSDEASLVSSRQAKQKCPQVVLTFYEEMLNWNST